MSADGTSTGEPPAEGGDGGAPPGDGGGGEGGGGNPWEPRAPYLEYLDDSDPLNRLGHGAVDDEGASAFREKQTVYDGYVTALTHDLKMLGFHEDVERPGIIERPVRDMILTFQRIARTTYRGGEKDPVPVTIEGEINGIADSHTRREIVRWQDAGWYYGRPTLVEGTVGRIVEFTAQQETGRGTDRKTVRYFHEGLNMTVEDPLPRAFQFLEEHPEHGLRVGLVGFSQRSGWLGRFLRITYEADPDITSLYFGADFPDIYNLTNEPTQRGRMSRALPADERWRRFLNDPRLEKTSRFVLWERILNPLLEAAARNRIRTIKGLAFLFEVAWLLGLGEAIIAADGCGYRDLAMSVEDHLRPGMKAVEMIAPPPAQAAIPRLQALLDSEEIDTSEEYFWRMRFNLKRKMKTGARI